MPYYESADFEATRGFYSGCSVSKRAPCGGYIGFGSGQAQVLFAPPGVEPALPNMGVLRSAPSTRPTRKRCGPVTR